MVEFPSDIPIGGMATPVIVSVLDHWPTPVIVSVLDH